MNDTLAKLWIILDYELQFFETTPLVTRHWETGSPLTELHLTHNRESQWFHNLYFGTKLNLKMVSKYTHIVMSFNICGHYAHRIFHITKLLFQISFPKIKNIATPARLEQSVEATHNWLPPPHKQQRTTSSLEDKHVVRSD